MNTTTNPQRRSRWRRWWSLWVMSKVDHDAVLKQVAEESGWSGRYAFLITVSAGLALLGLLTPSVAVVIGAMLLSPLMMPIIGLGFGIATLDFAAQRRGAFALAAGVLLAVALCVAMVALSPVQTITTEIAARTQPTLFDLLVALLSALAGAYAVIRGRGSAVVGVAIAIALMPPVAVVGFGIATLNWTVFSGALLLFLTNAITIALTAALVARAYGFGSHLSPRHTGWQLALFVVALGLLAVPLGAGLRNIAFQATAQRQVRDTITSAFPEGSRLSQVDIDYAATPLRVRAVVLTPRIAPRADRLLQTALSKRLSRPVDFHIDQLRISLNPGSAEAAEIASAADTRGRQRSEPPSRAIPLVATLAGVAPEAVTVDEAGRTLAVQAAPLSGLELAGYRALEERAGRAQSDWQVRLTPPPGLPPPPLAIVAGVVDVGALDVAGWSSARTGRTWLVRGGRQAQRAAIAASIQARGGRATVGDGAGTLRLEWASDDPEPAEAGSGDR